MAKLNDNQIRAVLRILGDHGQGTSVISRTARTFGVEESVIRDVGRALTEHVAAKRKPTTITEDTSPAPVNTSGMSAAELFQQRKAEQLREVVNRAESRPSLADCSIQELEALAAVRLTPSSRRG